MKLNDKLAIVTGGASGIGLATARTFAEAGAHVILTDINEESGKTAAAEIRERGHKVDFVQLDVTDKASIEGCKKKVLAIRPQVDIIAHVAGWGKIQPFVENTEDFWHEVVNLNLMGVIAVTRAFLDGMIEQKSGKIIVVSSDAGRVGSLGETVYSAAKGGVYTFTRSMALALGMYNITVNALAPALVEVDIIKNTIGAEMWEALKEDCASRYPLGRVGQPIDVANCALFLASDESSFITGQVIEISGGGRL